MRLVGIHVVCGGALLLLLPLLDSSVASRLTRTTVAKNGNEETENDKEDTRRTFSLDVDEKGENRTVEEQRKEAEETDKKEDNDDDLPILPPIILLDFDNGTDAADGNATNSEEKSKRTVNGAFGYGFDRNTILTGKTNYYFPAGKTGTTVSIEESISPFLPTTIVEKIRPNDPRYERFFGLTSETRSNRFAGTRPDSTASPIFGLRTKLHEFTNGDAYDASFHYRDNGDPSQRQTYARPYRVDARDTVEIQGQSVDPSYYGNRNRVGFESAPRVPFVDDSRSYGYDGYGRSTTFRPIETTGNYEHASSGRNDIESVSPGPFVATNAPRSSAPPTLVDFHSSRYDGQRQDYRDYSYRVQNYGISGDSSNYRTYDKDTALHGPREQEPASDGAVSEPGHSNLPRYTVENGVRYENKIFWKYPDGRVSHVPPATYVETYSPYSDSRQEGEKLSVDNASAPIREEIDSSARNNVRGPIQFPPTVPTLETTTERRPGQFVSSESISSSLPQQQVYRLGYQSLVGQKPSVDYLRKLKTNGARGGASSYSIGSRTTTTTTTTENPRSPTTDYRFPSTARPLSRYMVASSNPEYVDATPPTTSSSTVGPSLRTQSYPKNAFTVEDNSASRNPQDYYSDLLSYDPSISRYVKDPSSILNVQPTFVQAGRSLIPVIVLRVDGSPPSQTNPTPNINLRALLQRYIIDYAESIRELARPTDYDLGTERFTKTQRTIATGNRLLDLARSAPGNAAHVSTTSSPSSTFPSNPFSGSTPSRPSSERVAQSFANFGERTRGARPKTKSVEILNDPRFTAYKVKS